MNSARAQAALNAATRLEPNDAVLVELARQIYQARRERRLLTDWQDLFGEPAWDMLLDLYIAEHDGLRVTASNACAAADVPNSTALRWLHTLEQRGMIALDEDPADRRRSFVRLKPETMAQLNRYLRYTADGHLAFVKVTPAGARRHRHAVDQLDDATKQSSPA
jgi:DNA-binding MarR family transcriptional regulator